MPRTLKILVAEDVESNFLYLRAVLKKIKASVLWAENGKEAINMVNKNPDIDLVLMDLLMPEINGFEAATAIKSSHPNIKIVAQTAFAMQDDRGKAILSGCDEYIAKPIHANDLLSLIDELMNN